MSNADDVVDRVVEELLDSGETAQWTTQRGVMLSVDRAAPLLSAVDRAAVAETVLARLAGLSVLDVLGQDPSVTDIMINGPGLVMVERAGEISATDVLLHGADIERLVEKILGPSGRRVDRASPVVDLRLDDRTRCQIVVAPVSVDGPYLSIRRSSKRIHALEDFGEAEAVGHLREAITRRDNILVFGATGVGKTSLIAAVIGELGDTERVVVVEESAEIPRVRPAVLRLEAQPANGDGSGGVSVGTLVGAALRMRPDRLVLGEVSGVEAFALIHALATGHEGSLGTIHAAGPDDALWRLVALASGAEGGDGVLLGAQVARSVGLLVGLRRRANGRREIEGLYLPGPSGCRELWTC